MKTLKVVLQEVVSGLKAWVNTNTVHQTGNETINGVKTFSDGIVSDVTGSATSVPWTGVTGKPADYTPASHTHGNITNDGKVGTTANLPLITGTGGAITAGAFGNQANTFCEGNDSRLSDARTPVAHTHTKSDVTDLFNSANTWTEANTFSKALTVERNTDTNFFLNTKHTAAELGSFPSSDQSITWAFKDKNDDNLCYARVYYETTGGNSFRIFVRNKFTSGAPSTSGTADYAYFGLKINADKSKEGVLRGTFRPYDNNTYDLGSSSYQWNNLYAKNYYYNGTPWGLDKANTWTGNNIFPLTLAQKGFSPRASVPASNEFGAFDILDTGNSAIMSINYSNRVTGARDISFRVYDNSGNVSGAGVFKDENNNYSFCPITPNKIISLGNSTNKWKSLNGVNPGALSLPQNVSMDIDRTNWNLRGGEICTITHTANCYVCVQIQRPVDFSIWAIGIGRQNFRASLMQNGNYLAMVWFPCIVGFGVTLYTTPLIDTPVDQREPDLNVQMAKYFPCQGNV